MNNNTTKKLVTAAMFASLICLITLFIKIPSPFKGYINLGDGIVLLAGWMLHPVYSFLAAGIGAALADILSGYAIYAPASFVIKGLMAQTACFCYMFFQKKCGTKTSYIIGGIFAELCMLLGYFIFEGFLFGWAIAAVNIPINAIQGIAGILLGVFLAQALGKNRNEVRADRTNKSGFK